MARYQGQRFAETTVTVDGNEYLDCIFDRCTIVFKGISPVSLIGCEFIACNFSFDGPAALTLNFLTAVYHGMGRDGAEIVERTFDSIRAGEIPSLASLQQSLAGVTAK